MADRTSELANDLLVLRADRRANFRASERLTFLRAERVHLLLFLALVVAIAPFLCLLNPDQ